MLFTQAANLVVPAQCKFVDNPYETPKTITIAHKFAIVLECPRTFVLLKVVQGYRRINSH